MTTTISKKEYEALCPESRANRINYEQAWKDMDEYEQMDLLDRYCERNSYDKVIETEEGIEFYIQYKLERMVGKESVEAFNTRELEYLFRNFKNDKPYHYIDSDGYISSFDTLEEAVDKAGYSGEDIVYQEEAYDYQLEEKVRENYKFEVEE